MGPGGAPPCPARAARVAGPGTIAGVDFRCAGASRDDGEPMPGTAPVEDRWLMVEHDAPWGAKALAESRLPDDVRAALLGLDGVRVQLIRRHGRADAGRGVTVLAATVGADGEVALGRTVLDDVGGVLELDLAALVSGRQPLPPYAGPVWLVCTNGRRDVCCAESGRPVAAALARRWPEATWETTHLGGHRFAGTMVAWPAGVCLGRLDATAAVAACGALETGDAAGGVLGGVLRGRVGVDAPVQVALAHVAERRPGPAARPLAIEQVDPAATRVAVAAGEERWRVVVRSEPGGVRRQSCGDAATKPTVAHRVLEARPA